MPSLLALWLGWKEFKRWAKKLPQNGAPEALAASAAEGRKVWGKTIQNLTDKWPELGTSLGPLLQLAGGVSDLSAGSSQTANIQTSATAGPIAAGLVQSSSVETSEPASVAAPLAQPATHGGPITSGLVSSADRPIHDAELARLPMAATAAAVDDAQVASASVPTAHRLQVGLGTGVSSSEASSATMLPGPSGTASEGQLKPQEMERISALVCDAYQTAYMMYIGKQQCANQAGQPAPQEPLLPEVSGEQRKELRRIASDPRRISAYTAQLIRQMGEAAKRH